MSPTPKLPFYIFLIITVIVNVSAFVSHFVTGTALIIIEAVLVAANVISFEYGVNTSVSEAVAAATFTQ